MLDWSRSRSRASRSIWRTRSRDSPISLPTSDSVLTRRYGLEDGEFRTLASRDHRGCFGKSSGGYGAIVHGMRYPEHWGAVADHSGDAYFDFCYRSDWPNTLTELTRYRKPARRDGSYDVGRATARLKAGLDETLEWVGSIEENQVEDKEPAA